jgi:acetyltransferase-like isoleucine patch superfamily enzyme
MIKRLSRELSAWMIEFCRWAPSGIGQCLRLKSYTKRLKKAGNNCYIGPGTSISGWENISLENNVSIGQNCILSSSEGALTIGNNTGLNSNVTLGADFGSENISWFAVFDRKYKKIRSEADFDFIKFFYPSKFFPL